MITPSDFKVGDRIIFPDHLADLSGLAVPKGTTGTVEKFDHGLIFLRLHGNINPTVWTDNTDAAKADGTYGRQWTYTKADPYGIGAMDNGDPMVFAWDVSDDYVPFKLCKESR